MIHGKLRRQKLKSGEIREYREKVIWNRQAQIADAVTTQKLATFDDSSWDELILLVHYTVDANRISRGKRPKQWPGDQIRVERAGPRKVKAIKARVVEEVSQWTIGQRQKELIGRRVAQELGIDTTEGIKVRAAGAD